VRRQFRHQPVRDRLEAFVLVRLGGRVWPRDHAGLVVLDPSGRGPGRLVLAFGFGLRFDRQLVLRPDVASLDPQAA
jgi:hypothetical protein